MEEKNVALCILGVIAIIAVVGLVLMFNAQKEGASIASANRNSMVPYPGGVVHTVQEQPSYQPGTGILKYHVSSGEPEVEPAKFAYPPFATKNVQ
ncbi:hypothetical protein KY338_07030 [Candidatus Woesearchaeota archaeon]|nr:hypothetical protein [Candidatus Woesearchaeota archaeon]MBW3005387.1 hypothetical protein [Candidatus Woesearchaeota archaeon]